ncbi:MAG: HDIG domain-containing protein [Bacteroidales bacterium]|nr:HDIG domain-containing protein [Bacteroidales bacterium]
MNSSKGLNNVRLYVAFAVAALIMVLIYPDKGSFKYLYQKGRPWMYETLVAPFDFPLLKTDEQINAEREAKASEMIAYYLFDETVGAAQMKRFSQYAAQIRTADTSAAMSDLRMDIEETVTSILNEAYDVGIVASIDNRSQDKVIFIERGKRAKEIPASEIYTVEQVAAEIESTLELRYPGEKAEAIIRSLKCTDYVTANMTYDIVTSQMLHKESVEYISPTSGMVYSGQLIVSSGEIVTAEIKQMLDSYKVEYLESFGYSGSPFIRWISHIMLILVILGLLFVAAYYTDHDYLNEANRYVFMLALVLIMYVGMVIGSMSDKGIIYILPFCLYVLYCMAFFKNQFVMATYLVALLPMLVIADNGIKLYLMNAVAGAIVLISFSRVSRGWLQFVNCVYVFAGMGLVYLAFYLIDSGGDNKAEISMIALNALLAVICYPFVYLFEKIFSFVSDNHLWELTETSQPLLRELSTKAPGTFQHSLQVAAMSEEAARKIGANALLTKVGAMYHDIGKIENPHCFIENQSGEYEYHKTLSARESAIEIIRHVENGAAIARRNRLPEVIVDFILSHHGTTRTAYFYNKYCNEGGDRNNVEDFTYKGKLPHHKEEVILILADSIEAASRALKDYSAESLSRLVENIVEQKIAEQQFITADISLREIDILKHCFTNYLVQVHHNRIPYPKLKKAQE